MCAHVSMDGAVLTDFQKACLEAIGQLLRSKSRSFEPHRVEGKEEDYYRVSISVDLDEIEVYVYGDEAGYSLRGEWHIRESPDYDSDQDLISAFLEDLTQLLASGGTPMGPSSGRKSLFRRLFGGGEFKE